MSKRIGKKRLSVEILQEWHKELKYIALKYNITVSTLMSATIISLIKRERELEENKINEKEL